MARLAGPTVFYLEHLQPDWLTLAQQRAYVWLAIWLPAVLIGALANPGITLLIEGLQAPSTFIQLGVIGGLLGGLFSGLSLPHQRGILYQQDSHRSHQGLEVAFDAPLTLPPLPAAVEVAVYRIAQEALTNVARHAQARHCLLRLSIDTETLYLDISDDGQGIPAGHRIGVGLHAMYERANELGGSCTITSTTPDSSGGTAIRVRLPLAGARDALPLSLQETADQQQELTSVSDLSLAHQEE